MYKFVISNVLIDYWSLPVIVSVKEIPAHNEWVEHKAPYPLVETLRNL